MSLFAAKRDHREDRPQGIQAAAPVRSFRSESGPKRIAPPIVAEELNSSGQPLNGSVRALFETGFRQDFAAVPAHSSPASRGTALQIAPPDTIEEKTADRFADRCAQGNAAEFARAVDLSQVRIHTNSHAEASAAAVQALAYTSGRDIVFGTGQYSPHTSSGRKLLFHELGHVMQPGGGNAIHRKPDTETETQLTKAELARKAKLDRLAAEPIEAHRAWKHLPSVERLEVLAEMSRRYDNLFAQEFLAVAETGKFHSDLLYYQPGVGPKPEQLRQQGYRFAGEENTGHAAYVIERWVHFNGKTLRRDVSPPKPAQAEEKQHEPKPTPAKEAPQKIPLIIDDDSDEYKLLDESTPLRKKILSHMQALPMYNDRLWNEIQSLKANPPAAQRAEIEGQITELRAEYDNEYADLQDLTDEANESDPEAYKYAKKNSGPMSDRNAALLDDYYELKRPAGGAAGPP